MAGKEGLGGGGLAGKTSGRLRLAKWAAKHALGLGTIRELLNIVLVCCCRHWLEAH